MWCLGLAVARDAAMAGVSIAERPLLANALVDRIRDMFRPDDGARVT